MWCVVLQPKGTTTRNALIPAGETTLPEATVIGNILRRATAPELIGTWKWNGLKIHLYAYKTGKPGTENKHEIPPPFETAAIFGEAIMIATKAANTTLVSFSTTDYPKFYNETCAGGDGESDGGGSEDGSVNSGGEEEEEEEEPEDEVSVAASESDDGETSIVSGLSDDEEEEDVRPPVKIVRAKRNNKKIPAWFSVPELTPDDETRNEHRSKTHVILTTKCGAHLKPDECVDIERGIYNFTLEEAKRRGVRRAWENPEFQVLYQIQARRTITNIDPTSYVENARLLERLREGEFRPHAIPFMSYNDLFPEKWGNMIEHAIKREAKMLEVDKSAATDMFKCTRCGKRQCTYYEMQTRSADEPMTQFIRCLNCGKQWRQ